MQRKNDLLLATGNCVRKLRLPDKFTDIHACIHDEFFAKLQPWVLCASIKTAVIGKMKEL